jgi:hypothetical protein
LNYLNRSKGWIATNSLWLIPVFICGLNFTAFLFTGARAKHKGWIVAGWVYCALCPVLIMLGMEFGRETWYTDSVAVGMISWFVSIIHAFIIREEYLRRRVAIEDGFQQNPAMVFNPSNTLPTTSAPPAPAPTPYTPPEVAPLLVNTAPASPAPYPPLGAAIKKININTCTAQEMTALPGISVARAKKAIDMRLAKGGFVSFDDFAASLQLEPHFAAQIINMVTLSAEATPTAPAPAPTPAPAPARGRRVDIAPAVKPDNPTNNKGRKIDI